MVNYWCDNNDSTAPVHVRGCAHTHRHIHNAYPRTHPHTHRHIHTYRHTEIYIHNAHLSLVHTQTYTQCIPFVGLHTHTHTHTHTHIYTMHTSRWSLIWWIKVKYNFLYKVCNIVLCGAFHVHCPVMSETFIRSIYVGSCTVAKLNLYLNVRHLKNICKS